MLIEQARMLFLGLGVMWIIPPLLLFFPNLIFGYLSGPIFAGLIIKNWEVVEMPLIVLMPVIMIVTVGSIIGVQKLYHHSSSDNGSASPSNMASDIREHTKHVDEQTRNLQH